MRVNIKLGELINMHVNYEPMKTGFARIHTVEGGAISIYVDKEVGKLVTLPSKTRLKAIWDDEKQQLIIQEWKD